jgi:RNA polymerase sigma-70 factor (ECF subfamily)
MPLGESTNWLDETARAWALGKGSWPSLDLPLAGFAAFAGRDRRLADLSPEMISDLFLAAACAHNVSGALQTFRNRLFPVVAQAAKSYDASGPFAEEVYQHVSELMFVGGPDGQPKILNYQGEGPLASFIGTAARRVALRMATSSARFTGEEALVHQLSQMHTQETSILKQQHRDLFNRALVMAVRQLSGRERLVLRLNLSERVSTTKIAAMYRVSQPTVSRWIQRAARTIFAKVKDLVCDELDIDTRELESLLLLVRSQIEITISQADSTTTMPR